MAQLHSLLIANHRPYAAIYADATERLAATGFVRALGGGTVAFTADDLYKKVLQLDNATEWVLTAITPTWVQVSGAGSLANDSITNALLANMAQATIKGRASGAGTGDPTDLTGTQATAILNAVVGDSGTGGTKGLVPAPGAGDTASGKYLDAAGAFSVPPGTGLTTENVQDIVGAMVVAGTNVTVTYNDGAGTLTIDSTGGGSIAPLVIEGANEVSQRNSTNNQNFSVYRNYNSGSDYQRIRVGWTGTTAEIMSEAATQGASNLLFKVGSGTSLNLGGTSLEPTTTDVFVLGASNKYFSEIYNQTWITKAGGVFRFVSGARVTGPAQGIITWTDDTGNSGSGTIRFDNRTPATITSDQNNYSVPVTGYFIRLATDASRTLTGLTFGGGGVGDGQVHLLVNVGANDLVLAHENASSTAGNRFLNSTGANITLSANQAAEIIYDGNTSRWRVFKRN